MCRRTSPPKAERALEESSDPGELRGMCSVLEQLRVAKPPMSGLARPGNSFLPRERERNHKSRGEIPPPAVPCSATSSVCAYSQQPNTFRPTLLSVWGFGGRNGRVEQAWPGVMGTVWPLQPEVPQSDQQQRLTPCHQLREVLAAGIPDLESFPAKSALLEILSAWGGP